MINSSPSWFVSKTKYKIEFFRSVLSTDVLNNFPADIELANGIPLCYEDAQQIMKGERIINLPVWLGLDQLLHVSIVLGMLRALSSR